MPERGSMLGGCRVLDLTGDGRMFCGKLLGDLGADVIQIEPPGGSSIRNTGPFYHDDPGSDKSLTWYYLGLNKRGITLDFAAADGREVFKRLAKTADIIIEGFAPGYMKSLGLGYEDLEEIRPGIVMTSITPFGQTGPHAHYKVTDLVGVSMGGMVRLFGEIDRPPNRISAPQFYLFGGLHGGLGTMMAFYYHELTGEGQYVDVSCQEAVVLANRIAAETWDLLKINSRGRGPSAFIPRPNDAEPLHIPLIWPCKDGHVVAMVFGGAQAGHVKSSHALVAIANREGMALELKDFDWASVDASKITQEEIDHRNKLIGDFLLTKTKAELLDAAVNEEILILPVSTAGDVAENPQLAFREYWQPVEHPELGDTITYPGWPVKWTQLPPYRPQRRAPLVGEHNREVYQQELGLSPDEMMSLKARKVI